MKSRYKTLFNQLGSISYSYINLFNYFLSLNPIPIQKNLVRYTLQFLYADGLANITYPYRSEESNLLPLTKSNLLLLSWSFAVPNTVFCSGESIWRWAMMCLRVSSVRFMEAMSVWSCSLMEVGRCVLSLLELAEVTLAELDEEVFSWFVPAPSCCCCPCRFDKR